MSAILELRNAEVRFGAAEVLRSASLTLDKPEFVAIGGPNGAGKSTLLSLLAGLSSPSSGECLFFGQATGRWNRRAFTRRVAFVQQTEAAAFPFTAEQIVYMGRMPHRSGVFETPQDHSAVNRALATTETAPFRHRDFRTLSAGEKQRVLLASALAQEPEVLLLDEPSTHLDLQHQLSLHRLLREMSRNGILVVAVTHDLNLASAYADRLVLLHLGKICADGPPDRILRPQLIEEVFRVRVELYKRPSGQPWLVYGE